MHVKVKVTQSCLTLCNPMDYTDHGILQARILEYSVPFSRDQPNPRIKPRSPTLQVDSSPAEGSPRILEWGAYPFSRGSSQPGIEPGSPAWQADSLPAELPRKPNICKEYLKIQIIISDVDTPWIIWEDSERLNVCYRVKEQIIAGKSFSFKVLH